MKKHWKKQKKNRMAAFWALMIGCWVITYSEPVSAANRVPEMEVHVALQPDGSAHITQVWTADTDAGTEFYLACHDSGYLSITDFSVVDNYGAYTFIENWDVGASFEEKAGKCGIVETDEGVELCWGISTYGENRYTMEYVLHDLMGSYSDADGFNHCFVDSMGFFPTNVVLTVSNQDGTPLTDDICDVWAFGFEGQIEFQDGMIRAWSESPLESGQNMIVMLSLEKGIFSPLRTVEDSFETIKENAFEDSDYEIDAEPEETLDEEVTGTDILISILFLGFDAAFIAVVIGKFRKARLNKKMKAVEYFRDIPNNGNLNVTYELGRSCGLCRDDSLLGAYLLRLISDGSLEPDGEDEKPEKVKLRLVRPPRTENEYDDVFYTVLEAAAEDDVLESSELKRYSDKNVKPLSRFCDSCIRDAKQTLIHKGCLKRDVCSGLRDLTDEGKRELNEILGLKRFLLDFSLIHERGVEETVIWQDYMIYALLFGIADKVAPQMRALYPEALPQIQYFEQCVRYAGHYNDILYRAYQADQYRYQASRSSGSGGRSSFRGGGGSSGGGGGGIR